MPRQIRAVLPKNASYKGPTFRISLTEGQPREYRSNAAKTAARLPKTAKCKQITTSSSAAKTPPEVCQIFRCSNGLAKMPPNVWQTFHRSKGPRKRHQTSLKHFQSPKSVSFAQNSANGYKKPNIRRRSKKLPKGRQIPAKIPRLWLAARNSVAGSSKTLPTI